MKLLLPITAPMETALSREVKSEISKTCGVSDRGTDIADTDAPLYGVRAHQGLHD